MKGSRLLFISIVLIAWGSRLHAQDQRPGKMGVAIRAGLKLQNIYGTSPMGEALNDRWIRSYHAGVDADLELWSGFHFQTGLFFNHKGAESSTKYTSIRLHYIEVPLHIAYHPTATDTKLTIGAGPYLAYATRGRIVNGDIVEPIRFDHAFNFYDLTTQFRRWDAGIDFFTGYSLSKHTSILLQAQLGLKRINRESPRPFSDKAKWQHIGLGLDLSHSF